MEKEIRILLVEDNQPTVGLLRSIFKGTPARLVSAGTVREGIEEARRERPDVVLMDVNLPDGDGLSAVPEMGGAPVIAFSSIPPEELRERALRAGCSDYVHKPFRVDRLALQISRCLESPGDRRIVP